MNEWPIGFSTGCFYRRNILEVLEPIRDSGFREIEVCSFPRHLDYHNEAAVHIAGERMRELGLHPYSMHAPLADRIDITSPNDEVRRGALAEILKACDAASAMGVANVVLHPGPEHSGRPPEEEFVARMKHAANSLNAVAAHCCERGLHLVLENMLPHLLFGHVSDMMYLLGEISACDVGTCLDTGHAFLAGEMGTVIHKLAGHLAMVHVNDNRGERDDHLVPGSGLIDWPWVMGELRRAKFAGQLVLEIAAGDGEDVGQVLERACRARLFLDQICRSQAA